ncbi:DUF6415 family natural product biosynthesis protein [Streptomyces sp. NPDC058086]|uniref:DUF6415 family natural product biosynthesis protein n=1 Tax=Streptomyces sp. NPDC058086 TaxID=3346334 RepID=UPI0036EBFC99
MTVVRPEAASRPIDTAVLRADTAEILGPEPVLPRYERVQHLAFTYRGSILQLIPIVEKLSHDLPGDDIRGRCALAGIGESRRRLDEIEAVGLAGEVRRAQRLARAVLALCDHYDTLTGVIMCTVCDRPIGPDDELIPYEVGAEEDAKSGVVHPGCAPQPLRG